MSNTHAQMVQKIYLEIKKRGLILLADHELPNIVHFVTGEMIKGSWWGHAQGNLIYNATSEVAEKPDILTVKLLKGKVTFVHQELWEDLLAILASRDEWQLKRLSESCLEAVEEIDQCGQVLSSNLKEKISLSTKDIEDLEKRSLALSVQVHTETGAHAKYFVSWKKWASDKGIKIAKNAAQRKAAYGHIERCVKEFSANLKCLPWPT